MKRRTFVALGGTVLAAPRALLAQPVKRIYRIALLDDAAEGTRTDTWARFRKRLAERGWVEGQNIVLEARYAGGAAERLPGLAAATVAAKPDLIAVPSTPSTRAAMRATGTIPIVFMGAGDPIGSGLVPSLSRPGGNVTGISVLATETTQKSLELLRELAPGIQRLAYLTDPTNPNSTVVFTKLAETARREKISVQMLDGIGRTALERAFDVIRRERIQGLILGQVGPLLDHREQIIQFALREKLPAIYGRFEWAPAGGLLTYGADRGAAFSRGADLVDRILKGAKAGDLPVEQSTSFRLIVNLKTARALGIKIPVALLTQADEAIE
jgi:putative ABC transport system substrate-binding protein